MQSPSNPVLPTHPKMRHPHTGEPLRAVGIVGGRPVWPIIGASPDDGGGAGGDGGSSGGDGGGDQGGSGGDGKPAGGQGGDGGDGKPGAGGDKGGGGGGDKGYPANTPVAEMTAEQQAAYWRDKSQIHEGRNKELLRITGGKYGDDLKADFDQLEQLRDKDRTDGERAVEEAKTQTRAEVQKELGADAARMAFEFALGHDPDNNNDQSTLIDTLDLTKVLTDDGKVDTAKVRAVVKQIAPAGKGKGGDLDYGGGNRRTTSESGLKAGADMYESRNRKSK